MKILFLSILIISIFSRTLFAEQQKTLYFAPLPMKNEKKVIEEFFPLIEYMEKSLALKIKFNYKKDYNDILKGFMDGSIDMAYLGPLPYVVLKSEYSYIKPIVFFNQKNGTTSYRCAISKFSLDKFDPKKPFKVALTQPLSTCGYYITHKLLKEKFGILLENEKYDYKMSHTNALTSVMREEFLLAGSSLEIAKKFESLGMEVIAQSELLPAFAMVINTKTVSAQEIKKIRETLLSIPPSNYKKMGVRVEYGLSPVDETLYKSIDIKQEIPLRGNL